MENYHNRANNNPADRLKSRPNPRDLPESARYWTKVSDTLIDHFLRWMKPGEVKLFLVIMRKTRFNHHDLVRLRGPELRRCAGLSKNAFIDAMYRLQEAHFLDCHFQGHDWYVMPLPENHWSLENLRSRKIKSKTPREISTLEDKGGF